MRHSWTLCLFLGFFTSAVHGDAVPVRLFPGVTHAAVTLTNRTATAQSILLELLPRGGAIASASRSVLLGPGESQEIADLHAFMGAAGGVGMLRVTGSVAAAVRLRDQGDESDFKELPAVDPRQAIAPNEEVEFPFSTPAGMERDARSNLILVNLDGRDVTVTMNLGSITARKTIPAGAFVQIDNLGGFLGTPAGIASAHAVADGRWFGTIMTVRPSATTRRRRAVGPPPPKLLSSFGLIDKALAAGTINAEQALTYKVFADFGDSRLPAAFRGDDAGVVGADSPGLATQQWATLSPATQDLIGPYLVPAFYEGSWWDLRRAGATSIHPRAGCKPWENSTCNILADWTYVAGSHVRVWYDKRYPDDSSVASDLVHEVDVKIWPALITVMGREPILEHEMNGTKLLDVVITDNFGKGVLATTFSSGFNLPFGCLHGPTYVTVNRNQTGIEYRRSAFAHELFHSVQHAYNTKGGVPPGCWETNYKWLMESTATWFEDVLYPDVNREHFFAKHYLDHTELSLGTAVGLGDEEARKAHWYGAYTFFFYLTRFGGANPNTLVRNVWEATEKADALHALDAGLKKSGFPLEESWPKFGVYSWNEEAPYNLYDTGDGLKHKAKLEISGNVNVQAGDKRIELGDDKLSLPYLSMQSFRLDFPDAAASSVVFYNGIQRALVDTPVTWIEDFGNVLAARKVGDPASIKGAHVGALLKIDGKWTHEDWTDKPFKTFCRDLKKERIESVVIILSNSDIDIEHKLEPQGKYPPILQATNIGCYAWEGSADLSYEEKGRVEKMTVSNLRLEFLRDLPDAEDTPLRRQFNVVGGTFRWSISGSTDGCTWSAPVIQEDLGPFLNEISTFPYANKPAAGARAVFPLLFWEWLQIRLIVSRKGETCPTGLDGWLAGNFYLAHLDPTKSFAHVSSDGKSYILDASKIEVTDHDVTGTWRFTAKRE